MTAIPQHSHPTRADSFVPGSTGWSVDDLSNPTIERIWEREHYEIIEGVITTMPPAFFDGSFALDKLVSLLKISVQADGSVWGAGYEADLILTRNRVVKPDAMLLSPHDLALQKRENSKRGRKKLTYGRIMVPPTVIIESLSMGHESHDTDLKRRWYAEAGVPNYWLLNAYAKTLQCLILVGDTYRLDAAGKNNVTLKPSAFPGLVIPLKQIWD